MVDQPEPGIEKTPIASVVISTYNRADMVNRAISSAFQQTVSNIEVIVIDDGSTDSTERDVVDKRGDFVQYVKQQNRGVCAARNAGIELANGDYIAFLDSDDEFLPRKLEAQIAALTRGGDTEIGAAVCGT